MNQRFLRFTFESFMKINRHKFMVSSKNMVKNFGRSHMYTRVQGNIGVLNFSSKFLQIPLITFIDSQGTFLLILPISA